MLKALNILEIENIVDCLQDMLIWGQLQDVWSYDDGLVLQFWKKELIYVILEMRSDRPLVLFFEEKCPLLKGKRKKPAELFLKAHGKNLHLRQIAMVAEFGRVFRIVLTPLRDESVTCTIEVSLVPHGSENILIFADGKKSFWKRPQPLVSSSKVFDPSLLEVRSIQQIKSEWQDLRQSTQSINKKSRQKSSSISEPLSLQKVIEKKQKALEFMEKEANSFQRPFDLFAEELKLQINSQMSLLDLEKILKKYDLEKDFSLPKKSKVDSAFLVDLMKQAFLKARTQKTKYLAHKQRKEKVQLEIEHLAQVSPKEYFETRVQAPLSVDNAKVRKFELESGGVAYFGKSAEDNLKLLRAAHAWDIWLHLRDFPSRHVIIHRNKNQKIPLAELNLVFRRLVQESFAKRKIMEGERFEIVLTECRFVRPLKGAHKGKVTYSQDQKFTFVYR